MGLGNKPCRPKKEKYFGGRRERRCSIFSFENKQIKSMKKRVLFVCSQNKFRSRTAHEIFCHSEIIEVDSAGTEKDARVIVEPYHIEWADVIYVMEDRHVRRLKKMFGHLLKDKRVINLNIPDIYEFMDPGLIDTLRSKLKGLD